MSRESIQQIGLGKLRKLPRVTQGYGLLEGFLSKLRAQKADSLIDVEHRKGRILDIGCGTFPFFLAHTNFREKFGADKVFTHVAYDRLRSQGILITPFDVERDDILPFPDQYFDTVTMLAVIEHIEPARLPNLLGEILRIMKPGGMFILTTPAAWTDSLLRVMARLRLVSAVEMKDHKAAYTPGQLRGIFAGVRYSFRDMHAGFFQCFLNVWAKAKK
jgi:SAM-dependent methyltransferase